VSVFLDHGATTRLDPEVRDAMAPFFAETFGNPSSIHGLGVAAGRAIEEARRKVAAAVGGRRWNVTFTSGGTEANALAILGTALRGKRRHVLVSAVEHASVLDTARSLADLEGSHGIVPVSSDGRVDPEAIVEALRDDTVLVAVMAVNNEVGTVQPIEAIAGAIRRAGSRARLFVDAVQALGKIPTEGLAAADLVSVSAHKIHGPKGTGALLAAEEASLRPIWSGGGQESGRRSGTQNVAGIVGLGVAAERAARAVGEAGPRMRDLRDRLWARIQGALPRAEMIGSAAHRSPANLAVGVPGARAEVLLHALEAGGVIASSGSACHAHETSQSHVLAAMGVRRDLAVIRLTLGKDTTEEEVEIAASAFAEAVRAHLP
jgi:cysteine desulfurase